MSNATSNEDQLAKLEAAKNMAYTERNQVLALLVATCRAAGIATWLALHPVEDTSWDPEWRTIVFVFLPTGQASWHIHDSEVHLFAGILDLRNDPEQIPVMAWDGHTTEEKYRRVAKFTELLNKNPEPAALRIQWSGTRLYPPYTSGEQTWMEEMRQNNQANAAEAAAAAEADPQLRLDPAVMDAALRGTSRQGT